MKAALALSRTRVISNTDSRLFGSFVEQAGRGVYGGLYEPGHPCADEQGFRTDVLRLVRELGASPIRYPGGNFVSGYHWEDGIGDRKARPRRLELAWKSLETNEIGIDEFMEWTRRAGVQPMLAVNLGTCGIEDACHLLEYCNFPGGTQYSDRRIANGSSQPYDVKLWCLGNEMDGPWQIGTKTAEEYGRLACETAKLMKTIDPSIELVACGSSALGMPTFGQWEQTVLRHTYEYVDYISLHAYFDNTADDIRQYLAKSQEMEDFIKGVAAICDAVKAEKHSPKTIQLAFDEWNIWYHSREQDQAVAPWSIAPPILEDVYNFEDALLAGCLLITLLHNADRVKIACLAQLVNVIAPIMTETGGRAWAQTIYYPFLHASRYGRGTVLDAPVQSPGYDAGNGRQVPYVAAASVVSDSKGELTVFAVNRSPEEEALLTIEMQQMEGYTLAEHILMAGYDKKAANTAEAPDTVVPRTAVCPPVLQGTATLALPPLSWNVIRFIREK